MVQDLDVYQFACFYKPPRNGKVVIAGGRVAAGMVVNADQRIAGRGDGVAEDFPRVNEASVESATADRLLGHHLIAGIEEEDPELLYGQCAHVEDFIRHVLGGSNRSAGLVCVAREAPAEFQRGFQLNRLNRPNAMRTGQLIDLGVGDVSQIAEITFEAFGHVQHRDAGRAGSEEDREEFRGFQGGGAEPLEPFTGPLADGHLANATRGQQRTVLGAGI
jgi:hypothetical protein